MIWILIIILIFIIILIKRERKTDQGKPTEDKETEILLSVPYQKVQGKNWCLPACGAMIMNYHKEEVSQREIAQRVMVNDQSSLFKFMTYIKEFKYLVLYERRTMEGIEGLLREGIPLIVIQYYSINTKESHSRVIIGFNSKKEELTLHDPSGKKGYNMDYKIFHDLGFDTSGQEKIITIRRG